MEYIDVRTGDLVFFHDSLSWNPMSWLATLIRFFAKIKYNHVGVVVGDELYEAIGRGIVRRPLKDRIKGRKIKVNRRKEHLPVNLIMIRANENLGKKYDFAGLLWFQLWYQLFKEWIGFKSPEKAARKFYCYEFAAYVHAENEWWKVNPKDFINSKNYIEVYKN
jgi:hypothetical protein